MFKPIQAENVETVEIILDGNPVKVNKGMTVAAAVLNQNLPFTRTTPVSGSKRAPFCMMGVCFECLMVVNGIPNQRACATLVEEGMRIETQFGAGPDWEARWHG